MSTRIPHRQLLLSGRRLLPASRLQLRPQPRRWLTPAPHPTSTRILMSRSADRELPDVEATRFRWSRTLPLFILAMAVSAAAIMNYQKSSSSVVSSILYSLRVSPLARELLGDEIYFARRIPWIGGSMNQLRGHIDISFRVKGSRGAGEVRFASRRPSSRALWETVEWSVTMADGTRVDLLEDEPGGWTPLAEEDDGGGGGGGGGSRGFRQEFK